MKKRLISILLCTALFAGTVPVTALAGNEDNRNTETQVQSTQETGIDYKKNGGTFADGYEAPDSYPVSELPTKDQITKEGYEFDGWYENEDFSGEKVTSLDTSDHSGNIVLYAKWKERYYYVDIPETVSAESEDFKVTAKAGGLYDRDYVSVFMQSENNWKLKSGSHELGYELRDRETGLKLANDALVTGLTKSENYKEQNYEFKILDKAKYTGEYTDQLNFNIAFQDTAYYVIYETNGGKAYKENAESGQMVEVTKETMPAGTVLNQLPEAAKSSSTFLGWCYDEACTQYVSSTDRLLKDTTLYASYTDNQEMESVSMATYARATDVGTDFTIDVTDMKEEMTAGQIKAAYTIKNVSDDSEQITLEVTEKENHTYTISNPNGWEPGCSYRLELKDKALYFTGFDKTIREYDFSVYKEAVENLELDSGIKYIHISDLSDLTVNGQKTDKVSVAVMTVGTDGKITKEGSDTTGTFTYKKQKLNVGDQIAVYAGDVIPTMNMSSGKDSEVSFFEITGAKGNQYTYRGSKAEDVLFMPEVLPLSREKDLDGLPDNNSVTVEKSDLTFGDDEMSRALELDSNTTVDEGDYLALYTDINQGTPSYGEITSVSTSGNQYIVAYRPVTWEEVQNAMDVYRKESVEGDELLEGTDRKKLEDDIETQAEDSGFATEVVENIADAAMKTQSFEELQESLQEDMGADISLQRMDGGENANDVMLQMYAARAGGSGNPRVEAALESVKADLGTSLKHFDGDISGLRLALEIGVKITIHVNKGADIEILVTATFEQEVRVDINVDGKAVWKVWGIFPYIADYRVTASMDLYEYTGIGLNVNFKSVETGFIDNGSKLRKGVNKITEELKSMMENGQDYITDKSKFDIDKDEDISVSKSLAERYAELLKEESDWVEIYQRDLVNQHFRIILVIDIEIRLEFVVSANVNVSIGMTYWYKNAKRYVFCVYVKDRKASNDTIDLCEEQYEFTAYAMGTVGLKAGVRLTISIGLISTELASVGVSAEAGGYAQVWGYLYYELKYTASAGRSSRALGAVYLEIGIYLEVKFKAQALSNAFTYNPTLYENEWPLYKAGNIESVLDFAYTQKETEDINMKRDIRNVKISDNYFKMQYLHMKDGMDDGKYFEKIYDDSPEYFSIAMTNPAFTYNPEKNLISVNPGDEAEQDGEMIVTWRNQKGSFQTQAVTRRIRLHWDRLRDGYYIGFASNGGSYVNTITGKYNSEVKAPEDPVKQGYRFAGWYEDQELTKPYKLPDRMPEYDTLVYAKWEAADVDYSVVNHVEKTNGVYEEEKPVKYQAKTESEVSPEPENRTGYTTPLQLSATVKADGSTKIHYYYARAEHKVTFISEEEVISEGIYKYGAAMPTPAVYMPGYEFLGWKEEGAESEETADVSETVPDKDVTYTAKWQPKDGIAYTVKYYIQDSEEEGYELSEVKTLSGKTGEEVTAPDAGYSPKIYHRKGDLPKGKIKADGSLEMKAYYDLNSYKLTLDTKGGMLKETELIGKPGEKMALSLPVRKGYIFEGWYEDEAYEQIFGNTMPDEDTTVYAKWRRQKVNYTVRHLREDIKVWNPWEEEPESTYTVYEEETFSADVDSEVTPEVKSYEGFTSPDTQTVQVNGDGKMTVEYRYKRNVHKMLLYEYDLREGYVLDLPYGAVIPETPQNQGYLFGGWYTDEACTQPYSGKMPDHNISVYAKWIPQECEYEVTHYLFDQRTGNEVLADREVFTTLAGTEVTPETKQYTGYTAPDKITEYIRGWGNESVRYVYEKSEYKITYVLGGGEADRTEDALYEDNIVYIPDRSGYAFAGWYLDEQLTKPLTDPRMPAKNLTLYAKWEFGKKAYQVNHYLQKETMGDTYDLVESQNFIGTSNDVVTPEVKSYEGFTSPKPEKHTLEISDDTDTINYYYKRNSYQITYVNNDGTADTTEVLPYNSRIGQKPYRSGYLFKGWYEDAGFQKKSDEIVRAGNLTLYAKWEVQLVPYTVKYYLQNIDNDAYTEEEKIMLNEYTDKTVTPEVKIFTGFTAPEAKSAVVQGDGSLVMEYYYQRNAHELVLKGYNVDEEQRMKLRYGVAIPGTSKEGYIFAGWYLDQEYKNKFNGTMPDEDLTLYAKWTAKEVNYEIEYYRQNVEGDQYTRYASRTATGLAGSEVEAVRESYSGFRTPEAQKIKIAGDGSTVVKYYYDRGIYTVTFIQDEDDRTKDVVTTGRYKAAVKIPSPVKTGYAHIGWDKEPGTTIPDGDVTYTAVWRQLSYVLTFDTKGGTQIQDQTLVYGEKIKVPEDPKRPGYTFAGWKTEIPDTMPDRSMKIEAEWTLDRYAITYDLDGGSLYNPRESYTYEDNVIILGEPYKKGYTFEYWTDKNGKKVDGVITHNSIDDKKFRAHFRENTYTIQLQLAGQETTVNKKYGEVPPAYKVKYNDTITLPKDVFTCTGHSQTYWSKSADGIGERYKLGESLSKLTETDNAVINIYPVWKANSYKIRFYKEPGNLGMTKTCKYGETFDTYKYIGYQGLDFLGWDMNGDGYQDIEPYEKGRLTVAHDLDLIGVWGSHSVYEYNASSSEIKYNIKNGNIATSFTFHADGDQGYTTGETGETWYNWNMKTLSYDAIHENYQNMHVKVKFQVNKVKGGYGNFSINAIKRGDFTNVKENFGTEKFDLSKVNGNTLEYEYTLKRGKKFDVDRVELVFDAGNKSEYNMSNLYVKFEFY